MSITNDKVIEQVDTEIVLVIEDALGGAIGDSIAIAQEYANQALGHRNAAGVSADEAGEARDTAVDNAAIAVEAADVAVEQAAVAAAVLPTLVSIATDVIKTQTIVVNHHGFN